MYGGEEYDYGYDIVELPDSSILVTGTSGSFSQGNADAFLLKLNKYGTYQWSIPYGGNENDASYEMVHVPNVGVYLIGSSNSWSGGGYDTYVAFVSENGALQWQRTYDGDDWEQGVEAAMTRDSGAVIGINRLGDHTQGADIGWMRINQAGDTLWTKSFSSPEWDEISCIEAYRDSMFLISSNHFIVQENRTRPKLTLIHENGSVVWEDTVGVSAGDYVMNDFFLMNDTLFAIGGYKENDTLAEDICYYRYLIDPANPHPIQDFAIHSFDDWEGDVLTNYGNNLYRYGAYRAYGSWTTDGGPDLQVGRHHYTLGWLTGVGYIDDIGPEQAHEAIPTLDGGALMVGYTSGGIGGASVIVFKIGPGETYPVMNGISFVYQLVGVAENANLSSARVYPNPANESFRVELNDAQANGYVLLSTSGTLLRDGSLSPTTEISVSDLAAGVYLLQLQNEHLTVATIRILVQ